MKPIRFSEHSELQMILRGATKKEIEISVRSGQWERAKAGKLKTKHCFDFNSASPVNQKFYKYKTIEPIFAEESNEIIIVTVKVYYSNEEVTV